MKPRVAKTALQAGASMINDISGFRNPDMVEVAATSNCDICVMHMKGTPETMQQNPYYEEGIIPYLLNWFEMKVNELTRLGIKENRIILDPGIGFGKTVDDNFEIIHNVPRLKKIGFPVMIGISRKSFMAKTLNKPCDDLLPSTIAINTVAIISQVDIIRVHDVKEHRDAITVLTRLKRP
jgi:dihydropteroate synthase